MSLKDFLDRRNEQAQQQNVGAAQVVLGATAGQTPDQAAGDIKLAQEYARTTGRPQPLASMVSQSRQVFMSELERARAATTLHRSPRLAEWLRDPARASVARDDLENLSMLESLGRGLSGVAEGGVIQGIVQPIAGAVAAESVRRAQDADRSFGEILRDSRDVIGVNPNTGEEARAFAGPVELASAGYRWIASRFDAVTGIDQEASAVSNLQQYGRVVDQLAAVPMSVAGERNKVVVADVIALPTWQEQFFGMANAFKNDPAGMSAFLLETAGRSLPSMAAGAAVTAATRNPRAGAAVMGGMSAATDIGASLPEFLAEHNLDMSNEADARRIVADPALMSEALERGIARGVVIGAFDTLSGGMAGQALANNPMGDVFLQMLVQGVMGSAGEGLGQVAARQDFNLAEVMLEGLAEFATGPIEAAGVGGRYLGNRRRAAVEGEQAKALFEGLAGTAEASQLRTRLPEAFRQFVDRATAGGPVETIYIPAGKFVEFFQNNNGDPFAVWHDWELDVGDLNAAIAGDLDVMVPTSLWAEKVAGTDIDKGLRAHMRLSPEAMTASEVDEANYEIANILQGQWDNAEAMREAEERLRPYIERLTEQMADRLRAAGRAPDVAGVDAQMMGHFMRTAAIRQGIDPAAYVERYGLPQVRGSVPEGIKYKNTDDLTRMLAEVRRGRRDRDTRTSLLEWVSDRGGIDDVGGELKARDAAVVRRGRGRRNLRLARDPADAARPASSASRDLGKSFGADAVAMEALEAGFLADTEIGIAYRRAMDNGEQMPDILPAFWEAIDRELAGEQNFQSGDESKAADRNAALDDIEAYLDRLGLSIDADDDVIRQAIDADLAGGDGLMYAQSEQEAPLYVTHNLSAEKLRHAADLGGLAAPSLAIARGDLGFGDFGEISLIGAPSMADPKAKGVRAFNADVYSPRQPRALFKVGKKEIRRLQGMVDDVADRIGASLQSVDASEIERGGLAAVMQSSVVKAAWLESTGKDVPVVYEQREQPQPLAGYEGFTETDFFKLAEDQAFIDLTVKLTLELAEQRRAGGRPEFADKIVAGLYNDDGSVNMTMIRNRAMGVANRNSEIAAAAKTKAKGRIDRYATRDAIDAVVAQDVASYNAWVLREFGDVVGDAFFETAAGRKKDYTLDNLVREMTRTVRNGENWNYGAGNVRAAVAPEFKSLSAIKEARGQISVGESMKALKDEVNSEFLDLAERFKPYSADGDRFGFGDVFSEFMRDLAAGPRSAAKWDMVSAPDDVMSDAVAFLEKLKTLPAEYFEIKMQRAVEFSEFEAAIVPNNLPDDARAILTGAGLELVIYDPAIEGAREKAVQSIGSRVFFQGPLGSASFPAGGIGNGDTILNLFAGANLSTVQHEFAHIFLEMMRADAARGVEYVQKELGVLNGWLMTQLDGVAADARLASGLKVTADQVRLYMTAGSTGDLALDRAIDTGIHEQFARGFEAYLLEGKAPSDSLRDVFSRLRAWMLWVYKSVRGLNVNINDDLRGVFDRMLATDDEIAAAKMEAGDTGAAPSAAALGMTEEEYARFIALKTRAENSAEAMLIRDVMEPVAREKRAEYQAERQKVEDEVTASLRKQPVFRAIQMLRTGKDFEGNEVPDMRMAKDALVDTYGAGILATLPKGVRGVYKVDGGMEPDDAAGFFGFASGDELVRALERAPSLKEAIKAETDRVMYERHGDILNDSTVTQAALNAVHNADRVAMLSAELKAIEEVAEVKPSMDRKKAKAVARSIIERGTVRDAVKSERFLAAERKAGNEAARLGAQLAREKLWLAAADRRMKSKARAVLNEDGTISGVAGAIDKRNENTARYNETVAKYIAAKKRQLLNAALYAESRAFADELGKAERFVAKLNRAKHREKIAFAGTRENAQVDYLAAIDDILDGYDFRKLGPKAEGKRGAVLAYVEAMTNAGRADELAIPDEVIAAAKRAPYKALSVEALRGVVDALHNLEHSALRWNQFLVNKKKREFTEAVDTVENAIRTNLKETDRGWVEGNGFKTKARDFLSGYAASWLNANYIMRKLDGREDFGPVYELLKSDMDAAAMKELEMMREASAKVQSLYDAYTQDEQRQMAVAKVIPELGGQSLSKWNLIAAALNMGNTVNRDRLMNGGARYSFTEAQVQWITENLDARDAAFVQGVWDLLETYRPLMAERDRRIKGVEPKWVDAEPVTIGGVDLRGGYYPIRYDPSNGGGNPSLASDSEILQSITSTGYSRAATKRDHLKARGENGGQTILLDTSVISSHLQRVIHDLTYAEAVVNTSRILNSKQVERAFLDTGHGAIYKTLKLWVQDAGTGQVGASDTISRGISFLRSGFTFSKLAYSFKTALMQPLGVTQSMAVVGKGRMIRHMMLSYRNPKAQAQKVMDLSLMMRDRTDTFNKDLMDAAAKANVPSPAGAAVKEWMNQKFLPFGMMGMVYTQFYSVDVPTWLAAYEKGMVQFDGNSDQSVQYADMTVNRSQGSGIWTDRSGFERGTLSATTRQSPFVTLLTTLGSYFFAKLNLIVERTDDLRAKGITPQEVLSYSMDMALMLAGEAILIAAISAAVGASGLDDALWGEDDDDDDESTILGKIALEAGKTLIAGLPIIRDAAGVAQGFDGGTYDALLGTLVKPIGQAGQMEFDLPLVKSTLNAAGVLTKIPSAQINRFIDAAWRMGEGEDVGPLQFLFGKPR